MILIKLLVSAGHVRGKCSRRLCKGGGLGANEKCVKSSGTVTNGYPVGATLSDMRDRRIGLVRVTIR